MISIKNKTGNDYFTQWDTKQILVVTGELSDPVLHCRVDDTRAMVLPIKDGECTLDDTLLQKRGVLDVWVYDEHRTKRSAQFRVLPKPKPDDYVATPSAAKTWEDLDERVTALEKGGGGSSSADHEAVVANTAARHTHDNKSVLDGITGVVTEDNVLYPEHITDLVQYGAFQAAVPMVRQLGITSATVGQLARIKAVNDNGAPTAWEAVDMPSGGSGETWEKVAEVTTTEVVNSLQVNFDACKAVYIQFQWGGVEDNLGTIYITHNATSPYTGESRDVAAEVTTATTAKRGYVFVTIDARMGSCWTARSNTATRGDGNFGNIKPGDNMNCDVGVNSNNFFSKVTDYYMDKDKKQLADGIKLIVVKGAGMAIGTTLSVWGIKK